MAEEDRARRVCEALDRRLAHVVERSMRLSLVRERLLADAPAAACAWLAHALDRASPPRAASDRLRDAIVEVLMADDAAPGAPAPIPYAGRAALYAAAVASDATSLATLLRSHPARGETPGDPARPRLAPEVAEIPLGVRRSLAKGADPLLLEKLALDPDPVVIGNLLRNPRLREGDVVRIAAMRPVPASTLEEVARSARWSRAERVRIALARNPHCPAALAVKLIAGLPLPALRTMRGDPDLPAGTAERVREEIARRAAA